MAFNYKELEDKLTEACTIVQKDFLTKFDNDKNYMSPGGAKLEAFINDLQLEFETTTMEFLKERNLENDPKARSQALAITKSCAKKCLDEYNKIKK